MKVKARKLTAPEADRKISLTPRDPKNIPKNLTRFLRERLSGKSLLTRNGKIKTEFQTLADEVAFTLIEEARNGNKTAIHLLIQATEGDFINAAVLSKIIWDIYVVLEKYITDEDELYYISNALYRLKHRYKEFGVFTSREDLLPTFHENEATAERLKTLYNKPTLV